MHVVLLLPQIVFLESGGIVGGYVNSVVNLAAALHRSCTLTLVAGVNGLKADQIEALRQRVGTSVHIELIAMRTKPSTKAYFVEFMLRSARCVRSIRRRQLVDVVYGHSGFPGHAISTGLAGALAGARTAHCFYCPLADTFQHKPVSKAFRWLSGLGMRLVNQSVCISSNVANSFASFAGSRTSFSILPPAIPAAKRMLGNGLSSERATVRTIGFVGHHKQEKGLDLALDALKILRREGIEARLVANLSGGESAAEGIALGQKLASERGVSETVEFRKGVADTSQFFDEIDLLLVPFRGTRGPSDYPMVLLEAMAAGLITVSTPVGAVPEVVVDEVSGYLAADVTGEAIARKVRQALEANPRQLADMRERAAAAVERFRSDLVAQQTNELLQRLLVDKSTSGDVSPVGG